MKKFSITEETINKVFNYLSTKPYKEVAPLIGELAQQLDEQDNKETAKLNDKPQETR